MNRETWAIWEGPEIEGRLFGVPTLFIRHECNHPDQFGWLLEESPHVHIYFLMEFIQEYGYEAIVRALKAGKLVTIGLNQEMLQTAPEPILLNLSCHVQLIIEAPALMRLKSTDSIRFDAGPYHVYAAPLHTFLETRPDAYAIDTPVAFR